MRENVPRMPRAAFSQIVNRSMSEVLTRSLITGLSTVFLIGVLLVFGGETLQDFAFAMMVGVASGTYSSIFIAVAGADRVEGARARLPLAARARIQEAMGCVPAFPEDNVVARIDEVERHVAGRGGAGNGAGEDAACARGRTRSAPVAAAEAARIERARRPTGRHRSSATTAAGADAEETGDGVAGRPEADAERTKRPPKPPKKQSRRRRKPGGPDEAREDGLMAILVWFTIGVALWHFTVFVPDRFWGGIVGAFLGASSGRWSPARSPRSPPATASARPTSRPCSAPIPGALLGHRGDLRDRRCAEKTRDVAPRGPSLRARAQAGREVPSRATPSLATWPIAAGPFVARALRLRRGAGARRRARARRAGRGDPGPPRLSHGRVGARASSTAATTTIRRCSRGWPRSATACGRRSRAGRRITVHGDYDVDGVCSTAILVRALRELGADCDWLIPDRLGDGYGLTRATRRAARRARDRPADHRRLRDRLGRRGRGGARARGSR